MSATFAALAQAEEQSRPHNENYLRGKSQVAGFHTVTFEPIRTKALNTRTRGTTWEILPETEEEGFAIAHVFGKHSCYYARLDDLGRNTDRIRLFQKVRA